MSLELYQEAIKTYANAAYGEGSLSTFSGTAERDSPYCGDSVRVDVLLEEGKVAALAHQTRGCLLCRAAAAWVGLHAPGHPAEEVTGWRDTVAAILRNEAPVPEELPDLAMFVPARAYAGRHDCILLPFDTALAALNSAGQSSQA